MVAGIPPRHQLNLLDHIMAITMIALIVWGLLKISWLWVVGGGVLAMFAGGLLSYLIPPEVGTIGTPLLTVYFWISNPPW